MAPQLVDPITRAERFPYDRLRYLFEQDRWLELIEASGTRGPIVVKPINDRPAEERRRKSGLIGRKEPDKPPVHLVEVLLGEPYVLRQVRVFIASCRGLHQLWPRILPKC